MIKVAGMEQIPAKFQNKAADVFAYRFSRIINLLAKLSMFPEESEIAKLKPLFKKGSKVDDPKNYKPILLLPLVSEVIGKSMH